VTAGVFGDLMKAFPFVLPTRVAYGPGVLGAVGEEAAAYGRRALVVTDPGVRDAGLVEPVLESLRRAGLTAAVFADVEPNPRAETVQRGAAACVDAAADVIVALGGGSAIDSAKAISAVARHGGAALDYEGLELVPGPAVPVIAVPTTAGTGSEVTLWAIITDPATKHKAPLGSVHLAPRVALVDPLVTLSLPPALTATTAIDALTHAIESYTARCSNPVSDALALYAVELISGAIDRAVADGADRAARAALMLGSLIAGLSFGNSDTAAVHSLAEAIGGARDVPHGLANAIFLPYVVRHNQSAVPEKTARLGQAMGLDTAHLPAGEAGAATVAALFELVDRLGVPSLRQTGVGEGDEPLVVRLSLMNLGTPDNPAEMSAESFAALFREALGREGT
jgi:alcohol dehydrogenase